MLIPFKDYVTIARTKQRKPLTRLFNGWSDIMYDGFHAVWPTCSLTFTYNHIRKKGSNKRQVPYWTGKAKCKHTHCVTVIFRIQDRPVEGNDVVVTIQVTGECSHGVASEKSHDDSDEEDDGAIKKRFLSGSNFYAKFEGFLHYAISVYYFSINL